MTPDELEAMARACDALGGCWNDDHSIATDAAAALRSCAERLRAEEWQDISTAPRDGTVILLADMRYRPVAEVRAGWFDATDYDFPWHVIDDTKAVAHGDDYAVIPNGWRHNGPTHWRPRPAPPTPEEDYS